MRTITVEARIWLGKEWLAYLFLQNYHTESMVSDYYHYSVERAFWGSSMWVSTTFQEGREDGVSESEGAVSSSDLAFLPCIWLIMQVVQNMERQEQKYGSHSAVPSDSHLISNNLRLYSFLPSVIWMLQGIAVPIIGVVKTCFHLILIYAPKFVKDWPSLCWIPSCCLWCSCMKVWTLLKFPLWLSSIWNIWLFSKNSGIPK